MCESRVAFLIGSFCTYPAFSLLFPHPLASYKFTFLTKFLILQPPQPLLDISAITISSDSPTLSALIARSAEISGRQRRRKHEVQKEKRV